MSASKDSLPELPPPSAWIFRRWFSRKEELVWDEPDANTGNITPLYTAESLAAAIRSEKQK